MATNTTETMKAGRQVSDAELKQHKERAKARFEKSKQKEVSLPKNLQKYVGNEVPFIINGVRVVLPVDGSKHKVPEPFANQVEKFINNVKI